MSTKSSSRSKALKFLLRPLPIGVDGTAMENVESFSSWLHRLAQGNGLHSPLQFVFGKNYSAATRIEDCLVNPKHLAELARATGRYRGELRMMAFSRPRSTVMRGEAFSLTSWLLKEQAGEMPHVVCPTCIGEDLVPYWRKSWRLSVTVDCPVHGTPMVERCGKCNRRFSLHGKASYPLTCCSWCGAPIRPTTSKANIELTPSTWLGVLYSLSYGGRPPGIKPVFNDWEIAARVIKLLLSYAQAAEINNYWFHLHAGDPLAPSSRSQASHFPGATLDERRQVLKFVAAVMTKPGRARYVLPQWHQVHHRTMERWSLAISAYSSESAVGKREAV
jgi:hypothetical protein